MADWQSLARKAAHQAGVDPSIFVRLVRQESGGNPSVTSPAGAYGYTQLMPGTARGLGVNPRDPWQNMLGGARYLKQQLTRFGNYSDALRAYNAGPGAVQQSHGYAETNHYVATILGGTGGPGRTGSTPPGGSTPAGAGGGSSVAGPGQLHDPGGGVDVAALLAQLGGQRQPQAPSSMGIPAPAFAAHPVMPAGYQAPSSSGGPAPKADISSLLALVRTQPGAATLTSPAGGSPAGSAPAGGGGTTPSGGGTAIPSGGSGGVTKFEGTTVASWIAPALTYARAHGWEGSVASGVRSTTRQAQLYADFKAGRRAGPVAAPGTSNHEGTTFPRGAVDVSDAGQLNAILRHSPYRNKLIWAGSKDPVHFSHPHGGGY